MRAAFRCAPGSSPEELRDYLRKAGHQAFVILGLVIAVDVDATYIEERFQCNRAS